MKMKMFDKWLEGIVYGTHPEDYIKVVMDEGQSGEGDGNYEFKKRVRIYTDDYVYAIVAIDRGHNDGYLGCVSALRTPYVGEEHTRGHDLPDGKFNKDTWDRIKNAIIANELKPLFISKSNIIPIDKTSFEECNDTCKPDDGVYTGGD